jgi:hypothetical protein
MAKEQINKIENFNVNTLEEIKGKEILIKTVLKENPFVKIIDNKTYEEGKKSRTALRTCRTDLEKEEKTLLNAVKAKITEPIKTIYGGFKSSVAPYEDKQQEEVKNWEDKKKQECQEKLRLEEERKQKHRDNIDLFFNHNKKLIENLVFENLPFELIFSINDEEFSSESFEDFSDVFEAKMELLNFQLNDKINLLQEKENIRLENLRIETEKKESERKGIIKQSIDNYHTGWIDVISDMSFSDIESTTKKFNSEKQLECEEFKEEYDKKRASLARMLEAKSTLLNDVEKQRLEKEKLEEKEADLEISSKELEIEKQRFKEQKQDAIKEPLEKNEISDYSKEIEVNEAEIITNDLAETDFKETIISEPQTEEIEVVNTEIVSANIQEVDFEETWDSIEEDFRSNWVDYDSLLKYLKANYNVPTKIEKNVFT